MTQSPAIASNNVLEGGGGSDTISGGLGDDTYVFSGTSALGTDTIFEALGEGRRLAGLLQSWSRSQSRP